jgi:hypothetical protein
MRGESSGLRRKWLRRALLSAVVCLLAAPSQAQRIGPSAPAPHISPPIRIEPMRPIETTPIQPIQPIQPAQPLQPMQPLTVNPPPQATAVVPYCDKHPDQCRRDHHAAHAHAPHDDSQCPCLWYDHNGRRWVSGQYAKSCCR